MLIEDLEKEVEAGRVRKFEHTGLGLIGYNYTPACQYGKQWNDINVQCRGLVLDKTGKIIARPFRKFFNYEELRSDDQIFVPEDIKQILQKEDGSLIIVFSYDDTWWTITRGSFFSDQALLAQRILDANADFYRKADRRCTYLFELTGPSNVNVCRGYTEDSLILLSIVNTDEDIEYDIDFVQDQAKLFGFRTPKVYTWSDDFVATVKDNPDLNSEGVVVVLKSGLRFKIKSTIYCNLHRIRTGDWTPRRVMELWMSRYEGQMELDPDIPDEFYKELKERLAEIDTRWELWEYNQKTFIIKAKSQIITSRTMHGETDGNIRKLIAMTIPEVRPYLTTLFSTNLYSDWSVFKPIAYELFCKRELA